MDPQGIGASIKEINHLVDRLELALYCLHNKIIDEDVDERAVVRLPRL